MTDLAHRFTENPLLVPADIASSMPLLDLAHDPIQSQLLSIRTARQILRGLAKAADPSPATGLTGLTSEVRAQF